MRAPASGGRTRCPVWRTAAPGRSPSARVGISPPALHNTQNFLKYFYTQTQSNRVPQAVVWIRIQESKNDPEKYKKVNRFHLSKCWMFSFEL